MGKNFTKLLVAAAVSMLSMSAVFAVFQTSDTVNVAMSKFILPQYNNKTHLLDYILMGDTAKTDGGVIRVTNARIEFISADGKSVTGTLTSPEVFYNQSTQFLSGNQPIQFKSENFDAYGIGFDASQISESLHVRKDVKLVIRSFKQSGYDFALNSKTDTHRTLDTEKTADTPHSSDAESNSGEEKQ